MKKKILFIYRSPRQNIFQRIKEKREPDHFLYGLNYFSKIFRVEFSDIAYKRNNLLFWLFFIPQKLITKITSVGFKIDQAILLAPRIRKADIIVTTADSAGLPVLLLKKLKAFNKPVIYISTGFINEIRNKNNILKIIYSSLLNSADLIMVHSKVEKTLFGKTFPTLEKKLYFNPFGIDYKYFSSKKKGNIILSVGRDKARDFSLLSKVAKIFPNNKFIVVTSRSNTKNVIFPKNVNFKFDISYDEVKKLYGRAMLVFIPLKEIKRASGQVSFLESIASKNKVVIANIIGIRQTYPNLIKSRYSVYTYEPGSVEEAADQIKKALSVKFPKNIFPREYSSQQYANRLLSAMRKLAS